MTDPQANNDPGKDPGNGGDPRGGRDRWLIGGVVFGLAALAWFALGANRGTLTLQTVWLLSAVAVMLPAGSWAIAAFSLEKRRRLPAAEPLWPALGFALGHLVPWLVVALLATRLHRLLMTEGLVPIGPPEGHVGADVAGLLLVAGLFQWTPWKLAALTRLRRSKAFLLVEWRDGLAGALTMGLRYGALSLASELLLFALLLGAGGAGLGLRAVVAALLWSELMAPRGDWFARGTGSVLIAAGVWLLATA